MFELIILPIILGFLVGVGTELFLGRDKAKRFPGGSLAAGMAPMLASNNGWIIASGAFFGIVGWLLYITMIDKIAPKKTI